MRSEQEIKQRIAKYKEGMQPGGLYSVLIKELEWVLTDKSDERKIR